MTSPIGGIQGIGGFSGVEGISGLGGFSGVSGISDDTGTAAPTGPNADFAGMLAKGLEGVQASQSKASELSVQVANGTLADPAQYTMASTEAALGLQLTMAIRNKAVEAFQEIMRMQA
ncbi:flagellar hook-basal body complex protein FliE [Actinoplanes lutulentus]|uniref:Flagellar hook-basal body complex protein FliE n=1 Tax=Actinoplanes lutulentus TaxID=1287878 RepID=A0A327ZKM7_9ACTN|nr:flagellar hook-basal body complex protein FliE [Actinoplanes lutulentus]RAK37917.1 flagellar hook-basal body complex protein FliE [Actinoplanes lutulentus]